MVLADFLFIGSLLLSTILIVPAANLRLTVQKIVLLKIRPENDNYHQQINKINLQIRILFFFIIFIILSRLAFLTSWTISPVLDTIEISYRSLPFFFILIQVVMVFIYGFLFLLFIPYFRLRLDARYKYLFRLIKKVPLWLFGDVLISLALFFTIYAGFTLPGGGDMTGSVTFNPDIIHHFRFYIAGISLTIYVLFYLLFQKRRIAGYLKIFIPFYVIFIFSCVWIGYSNLPLVTRSGLLELNAQDVFGLSNFFAGLIWLILLMAGLGAQLYSILIVNLKSSFMNPLLGTNYILQLNRLAIFCAVGIGVSAFIPDIMHLLIIH